MANVATGLSLARLSSAAWRSARRVATSSASKREAFASKEPLVPPVISPLFLIMVPSRETTLNLRSPPKVRRFASSWVSQTMVSLPRA